MSGEVLNLKTAVWVQPDGPNTVRRYLGCHGIDGVTVPRGNNTLHHCKTPTGGYQVIAKTKAAPGLVTFTVNTHIRKVRDYMEELDCPAPIVITAFEEGAGNDFANWVRAWVYPNADAVQRSKSQFVSMGADSNLSMQGFDMEADEEISLFPLKPYRDSGMVETQALNDIFACGVDACATGAGERQRKCDKIYAVSDALVGSASNKADVWINTNGTWAVAAADPFATSEHILAGVCFPIDRNTTRILVFRGSTDAANPAEAAYSDDDGATWTLVNIGTTNAEFVISAHSAFALDQNNIWVASNLGRIYFSSNGGATWTTQDNQGIHTGAWNWIEFIDERTGFAAGVADVIAITVDGGDTWTQVTATGGGSAINTGAVIDANRFWVGDAGGRLYYTDDAGTTWTRRSGWTGDGVGQVRDLKFVNEMVGIMASNNAAPKATFLMTKDGGYSWETIVTSLNTGINAMLVCSPTEIWAAGEVSGGTAMLYKLQPVS